MRRFCAPFCAARFGKISWEVISFKFPCLLTPAESSLQGVEIEALSSVVAFDIKFYAIIIQNTRAKVKQFLYSYSKEPLPAPRTRHSPVFLHGKKHCTED